MSASDGRSGGPRRPRAGAPGPNRGQREPGGGRDDSRNRGGRTGDDRRGSSGRGEPPRPGRGGQSGGYQRQPSDGRRGVITVTPGGDLPRWVKDEIVRSTPKIRREAALQELRLGLGSYSVERYRQAAAALRKAKDLAPRAATVRELLGLSLYQLEDWDVALRELRTYRRLTGDTSHLAVEMDCLRAMNRPADVAKTWATFEELGADRDAEDEIRVVYASHLLDSGNLAAAWRVIKPARLSASAPEPALRRWAVAARVAKASGDMATARTLVEAIRKQAPDAEWLEDLQTMIGN